MIKTKTPQVIDAQTGKTGIVFFSTSHELIDDLKGVRTYNIAKYIEVERDGNMVLMPIGENKIVFKESTIQQLFGSMTLADFQNEKNKSLLIGQIDFINKYEWTGNEAMPEIRYWDLTASDLEIVS